MDNNNAFDDFTCDLQTAKLTDKERGFRGLNNNRGVCQVLKTFPVGMISRQNFTFASLI